MKFSWKILLCTMLIMAAACGASGYFFVNYVFQTSMERETRQALDESSILRFAFETAALNIPSKYDVLPDGTVECRFKEPQRAITPGQAVVFYENDCVVGGGTIL